MLGRGLILILVLDYVQTRTDKLRKRSYQTGAGAGELGSLKNSFIDANAITS